MICETCKKQLDPENAMHCPSCGRQFCPTCGGNYMMCTCYGKLEYYQ